MRGARQSEREFEGREGLDLARGQGSQQLLATSVNHDPLVREEVSARSVAN